METLFNLPAEISPNGGISYDMNQFKNAVKELAKPEKRQIRIVFIEDYQNVTVKQLNYYHGFLLKDVCRAYDSIGYKMNVKQADKEMREMFLIYYRTQISTGKSKKIVKSLDVSSSKLPTTKEMSGFFEDIVQHCSINMNYFIQLPSDIVNNNLNFNR